MSKLTTERIRFHEVLRTFAVGATGLVYDVGVRKGGYADYFPGCTHRTIDCDPRAQPDLCLNVEHYYGNHPLCDLLICNGVTEQCDDPFALARGAIRLLKSGGRALWGIMSVGYPIQRVDKTRFTPNGAVQLLTQAGFTVETDEQHFRAGIEAPTYLFLTARRP